MSRLMATLEELSNQAAALSDAHKIMHKKNTRVATQIIMLMPVTLQNEKQLPLKCTYIYYQSLCPKHSISFWLHTQPLPMQHTEHYIQYAVPERRTWGREWL